MTLSSPLSAPAAEAPLDSPRPAALRRQIGRFTKALAAADGVTLIVAASVGWSLRHGFNTYFTANVGATAVAWEVLLVVATWLAVLVLCGAYRRDVFSVGYGEYTLVARASITAIGCIGFLAYLTRNYLPRGFLVFTFAVGLPLLLGVRFGARQVLSALRRRGRLRRRAIVVGPPAGVRSLLSIFGRESWTGYGVVGVCVPEHAHDAWSHEVPVLGVIGDLAEVVRREQVDTVVVTGGTYGSAADLRRVGWALEGQSVDLLVAPTLTDVAGPRIRMRNAAGLPLVHVAEPSTTRARGPLKRAFDLSCACALLVLCSPVLAVIAVAIKVNDRGPIFYRQTRVGVLGEPFSMIKFRSMVPDADAVQAELEENNEYEGVLFKIKDDPRITRVGRFLRRYSLDELPQLFNVVRGEMSLVGPRPALPSEVDNYGSDMRRRLLVQPGVTGLWQVSGRSDLPWQEAVRLDLYYVDNWSMVGDLVILAKTARAVLTSSGAY